MGTIFGPVPSRRLGRSLGIDLVPFKTCSYDCIYCQLGKTTNKTVQRKEWVSLEDVLLELETALASEPDYITLSGSGEPTLYARIGELIDRIEKMTDVPVAVLTNGSMLREPSIRQQLLHADLVIPSLDVGDETMFQAVNRPHETISFDEMLDGLIEFRRCFQGQYWLEIFLMAGHTGIPAEVKKIAACAREINPDRIQLNTVTRPPTEKFAVGVTHRQLEDFAKMFDPVAEVIADFRHIHRQHEFTTGRENVLELLRRRPCTVEDIADGLGMHRNEVVKYLEELNADNTLEYHSVADKLYYKARIQATT